MKKIIWSGDINIEDYEDYFKECYPEVTDETQKYILAKELNASYLDDEKMNTNVCTTGPIIAIANLQLWNGYHDAHKILGSNISEIFDIRCDDLATFYSDGDNICCTDPHHDGINHYTFRIVKGTKPEDWENNIQKLFSEPINEKRIKQYTYSLVPIVNKVYGWD